MRSGHLPAPTRALLDVYCDPAGAERLPIEHWTPVLGAAHRSSTLAHAGLRLQQAGVSDRLDPRVTAHLHSVSNEVRRRRQQIVWELHELGRALRVATFPVVLLKGSAYIVGGLALSRARFVTDVDLLVPGAELDKAEWSLRAGGWQPAEMNDYDERYYRQWSHELPPFAHPEREVEVDLHHSITPDLRGHGVDVSKLLAASVEVEWDGHRRFRVLQPVDQLIHCAVHTFKDSELSVRLREAMDFDQLWRHYSAGGEDAFGSKLVERAIELGQERPLWWAIHFTRRWLGSPIPEHTLRALPAPGRLTVGLMNALADRAMLPGLREQRSGLDALAEAALLARYQYQRLPLTKLIPHVIEKSRRQLFPRRQAEPDLA